LSDCVFHHTTTTASYTLSLHDALPISAGDAIQRPLPPRVWTHNQHLLERILALVNVVPGEHHGMVALESTEPPIEPVFRRRQVRSEEHTSELQSRVDLVCRLLLEKKNT